MDQRRLTEDSSSESLTRKHSYLQHLLVRINELRLDPDQSQRRVSLTSALMSCLESRCN